MSSATDDVSRPRRAAGITVADRRHHAHLVHPGGGSSVGLNETALAIWDLCDGSTTVDEMVDAVVTASGIPESQARQDVEFVIGEFTRLGVVTD